MKSASFLDLTSGDIPTDSDYLEPSTPTLTAPLDDSFLLALPPPPPPPPPLTSTNEVLTKNHGLSESDIKEVKMELTEANTLLFSGLCYGFSLSDRRWAAFSADRLTNVEWRKQLPSSLVVSTSVLKSMRTLVQSHSSRKQFDDSVPGKGKGLIGLLSGQPGLGKTFTAEALAGTAENALYSCSSGALGSDASGINNKLRTIMDLCAHWRAVLLLDEVDVFLARRNIADISRNAVVSGVLRELGSLFLPPIGLKISMLLFRVCPSALESAFATQN